jgi:hypothetical protein
MDPQNTLQPAALATNTRMYRIEESVFIDFEAIDPGALDRIIKQAKASKEKRPTFEAESLLFSRIVILRPAFENMLSQARLMAETMGISWNDIPKARDIEYKEKK